MYGFVKKIFAVGALCAVAALLTVSVFAHGGGHHGGHHSGQSVRQAAVSVCPVEDCTLTGRHTHDGVTYCGYDHAAGFCDGMHGVHHACRR